jgi:hypothetical protein
MKYIYLVTRHTFFNNNGVDTAMAFDTTDVKPFTTWKKAEEYVCEKLGKDLVNYIWYDFDKDMLAFANVEKCKVYGTETYNENGVRVCYRIVKQVVE